LTIKNLAELACIDDLEITSGVTFKEDKWRVDYAPGEHVSFIFNDVLDCTDAQISEFPDLKQFLKILVFYSFPGSVVNNFRSWESAHASYWAIRNFFREFFFAKFLITKNLIRNVDSEQIRDFLDRCADSADHSPKFAGLLTHLPRVLNMWVLASQTGAMPDWCRANFTLSEVVSKHVEEKRKLLNEEREEHTWVPLSAHQVKASFDVAHDYIYRFSQSICEASYLVETRPRMADGKKRSPVREDGKTKELFQRLLKFKAPTFPGTTNRIFEFKPKTQRVRSHGYKCGYQDRTTIDVGSVRPEVINLKRACIFVIGLLTGLRRGEIAFLKVGALFVRDGREYLKITRFKTASDPKRGKADEIPVPAVVADAVRVLEELFKVQREELQSDFLLVSDIVTENGYKKIKKATISKDIRKFITESSGEAGHAHQLRKTIAWLLISKGEENVDLIRQLFGHKSYGMTLRYILRNELLSGSVMELLEENYTEDLREALEKITSGEAVGELADTLRKRSVQHYPGQILASDVEAFVNTALENGVPLFISRIPIGGFCISCSDLSTKKPPCIAGTGDEKPNPEFCDYLNCPHVLHTSESAENVERQIAFYEKKLRYIPEESDERVQHYYESLVDRNKALISRLKTGSDWSLIPVKEVDSANDQP
jgi:hypothetical protein